MYVSLARLLSTVSKARNMLKETYQLNVFYRYVEREPQYSIALLLPDLKSLLLSFYSNFLGIT